MSVLFPNLDNVNSLFESNFKLPEDTPLRKVLPRAADHGARRGPDELVPSLIVDSPRPGLPHKAAMDLSSSDDDDKSPPPGEKDPQEEEEEEEEEEEREDDDSEDSNDSDDDDDDDDDDGEEEEEEEEEEGNEEEEEEEGNEDESSEYEVDSSEDENSAASIGVEEDDDGDDDDDGEKGPDTLLSDAEMQEAYARYETLLKPLDIQLPDSYAHAASISGVLARRVPSLGKDSSIIVANELAIQRAVHTIATVHAKALTGDQVSLRHIRTLREDFLLPSGSTHDLRDQAQRLMAATGELFALRGSTLQAKIRQALLDEQ